ncbi:MAG TPA: helix-turn-helix transcriptional regulator [Thermomicrobiales bacterium]|nr:helix-turn-helix transcriptional regulator [Thermomicrobiales bacterium]
MNRSAPDNEGTLGDVIRRRRLDLGWSQEELAVRASSTHDDVRQSDISRLELGKVGLPRRARLTRIAAALDLPLGELLERSGWMGTTRLAASVSPATPVGPAAGGDIAEAWSDEPLAEPPLRAAGSVGRLHEAIAAARLTMARSGETLARARETYDSAARSTPVTSHSRLAPTEEGSDEEADGVGDGARRR